MSWSKLACSCEPAVTAVNLLQICFMQVWRIALPDGFQDAVLQSALPGWGPWDRTCRSLLAGRPPRPGGSAAQALVTEAVRLLRPGGKLVYPTNKRHVDRNEGQVLLLKSSALSLVLLEPDLPAAPSLVANARVDEDASNAVGLETSCCAETRRFRRLPALARNGGLSRNPLASEFGLSPALRSPGDPGSPARRRAGRHGFPARRPMWLIHRFVQLFDVDDACPRLASGSLIQGCRQEVPRVRGLLGKARRAPCERP